MSRKEKIYSPRTLAAELAVPIRTVLVAIRRGQLRCARLSRCIYRIEGADVDEWLASLKK